MVKTDGVLCNCVRTRSIPYMQSRYGEKHRRDQICEAGGDSGRRGDGGEEYRDPGRQDRIEARDDGGKEAVPLKLVPEIWPDGNRRPGKKSRETWA